MLALLFITDNFNFLVVLKEALKPLSDFRSSLIIYIRLCSLGDISFPWLAFVVYEWPQMRRICVTPLVKLAPRTSVDCLDTENYSTYIFVPLASRDMSFSRKTYSWIESISVVSVWNGYEAWIQEYISARSRGAHYILEWLSKSRLNNFSK